MKIGPLETKGVVPTGVERRQSAAKDGTAPTEPSAKVQLSPAASQLATAQSPEGSFDAEKVNRISQAIRDGKFEVNAGAIADKLIQNARDLLGPSGRA